MVSYGFLTHAIYTQSPDILISKPVMLGCEFKLDIMVVFICKLSTGDTVTLIYINYYYFDISLLSMSFAFVPRTISKVKKPTHSSSNVTNSTHNEHKSAVSNITSNKVSKGKEKADSSPETRRGITKYSEEDYANLLNLALSDYAMWLDPDLRRNVEWNSRPGPGYRGNSGCRWPC